MKPIWSFSNDISTQVGLVSSNADFPQRKNGAKKIRRPVKSSTRIVVNLNIHQPKYLLTQIFVNP
jgi:hypothetical protein